MNPKGAYQNDMLIKRLRKRGVFLVVFIILFIWFGGRLVTVESPDEWKEADITVADVRQVSLRFNSWQITDTEGNTYAIHKSKIVMNQILPQNTYHIVCSPDHHVRAITQGDTIIVDYENSVTVYCERGVWEWSLAFLGIIGSLTTIVYMIMDVRKAIVRK